MKLHQLKLMHRTAPKKRVGRGIAAGQGKTAGRGTKGQKARKSFDIPKRFEGGQTPLIMRLPKLNGMRSLKRKPSILNYRIIENNFPEKSEITIESLIKKGLLTEFPKSGLKLIGEGTKKYSFKNISLTKNLQDLNAN